MPLATNNEALAEFGRNAGMDRPEQEWLLSDWDVWVRNPCYTGPPGRHPEDDQDEAMHVPTNRDRLLVAAGNVILDSAMRAQARAEHAANVEAWEKEMDAWEEATRIKRNPGCTCSDQQLTLVGCECFPF